MITILGISGSLREESYNTNLLHVFARQLPEDVHFELLEELGDVPRYDPDDEHDPPPVVQRMREAVRQADAVIMATPEYNASVPGHLKNAIDWMSRPFDTNPFRGKPVAVVSASTGRFGGIWAQNDLRRILASLAARTIDSPTVAVAAADVQMRDGDLHNAGQLRALAQLGAKLIEEAARDRAEGSASATRV